MQPFMHLTEVKLNEKSATDLQCAIFFSLSLAADCGPGSKLKFKITRARYRPMNQRERSGEFIAGLPCKYKNGYSQLFDARARAPSPNPLSLSLLPPPPPPPPFPPLPPLHYRNLQAFNYERVHIIKSASTAIA